MEQAKMIRQANQIAEYFSAYPPDRAAESVVGHIRKFWAPPLRQQLVDYLEASGAHLHPLVAGAARDLARENDRSTG